MALATPKFDRPDDAAEIGYLWQFDGTVAEPVALDATLLGEVIRDVIGAALVQGTGITVTVNDGADTITIATTITQYTDEMARDAVGAALVEGTNVTITVDDASNTITIDAAGGGASDLDDLSDVAITAAAEGDILRHNGTVFVDTPGTDHFEVAGAVATHNADTTAVHGIADTSALYVAGGTDVAVADGGTGASNAATARTNLGLVIGTHVQAWDAQLDDLAALAPTKGRLAVGDGTNWVALAVGSNTHVLTADSGEAAGVKWAAGGGGGSTPSSFKIYKARNFR